jgi:hypothetical protein
VRGEPALRRAERRAGGSRRAAGPAVALPGGSSERQLDHAVDQRAGSNGLLVLSGSRPMTPTRMAVFASAAHGTSKTRSHNARS